MRPPLRVAAVVIAAALAAPATATAHSGLTQRQNLPIPDFLFGWAAAVVLIASFGALAVLWPQARLETTTRWRPIGWGIGRFLGSRPVEVVCGIVGVALLVVTIVGGYLGPESGADNFAPTFILITFWVGLVFASILFGDLFRAFSPWRAIGRATGALLGRRRPAPRPYPERLGRWPAALVLLIFPWIELVGRWDSVPKTLVSAALGYTVITLAAQAVWGTETWSRRGEGFAVYFNLFSRIGVFETRDRVVGVRPPLSGLPKLEPAPGTVAVIVVMIGTVTFDGLSQGPVWNSVAPHLQDFFSSLGFSAVPAEKLAGTVGLLFGVALIGGFYQLGMDGTRSVGGNMTIERLRTTFIHTLVPIAAVYVAAHYLTYFLFEGQRIRYLASDPFGQGWDLFGSAASGIDYSLLSQNGAWYLEVLFVVLGHVAALTLAHDKALAVYGQARTAVRSQYWMLGVMVGFTSLALWLLANTNK
jgi:hypothetical protein